MSSGSQILLIDPSNARVESTFASGFVADALTVSAGGRYLYAATVSEKRIRRFEIATRAEVASFEISFGARGIARLMIGPLPGAPESVVVLARGIYGEGWLAIYDSGVVRGAVVEQGWMRTLHVRFADSAVFVAGLERVACFRASPQGLNLDWSSSLPVTFADDFRLLWHDKLLMNRRGHVFGLEERRLLGRLPLGESAPQYGGCPLLPNQAGDGFLVIQGETGFVDPAASIHEYALPYILPKLMASLPLGTGIVQACPNSRAAYWGDGTIAITGQDPGTVLLLRTGGLAPVANSPLPDTAPHSGGGLRLMTSSTGFVYDHDRKQLWATVGGDAPASVANSVIAIEPASGEIKDVIRVGSEPRSPLLSSDGSTLYLILEGSEMVAAVELATRRLVRQFSLLNEKYWRPAAIAIVPGQPAAVVVAKNGPAQSYTSELWVYDGVVPRPRSVANISQEVGPELLSKQISGLIPGDSANSLIGFGLELMSAAREKEIYRYLVDETGIRVDRGYRRLRIELPVPLIFSGGEFFTSQGEVWDSETEQLRGRFQIGSRRYAVGAPVRFPERNAIAYVVDDPNAGGTMIFDLTTFRLRAFLPLPAVCRFAAAAGSDILAVAAGSDIVLLPLSSIPEIAPPVLSLSQPSRGVRRLKLPSSSIVGRPNDPRLLLTTPGSVGPAGNNFIAFDTERGELLGEVYAGNEPSKVVLSDDGKKAYAWLSNENRVARFDIETFTRDLVFSADPDGQPNQYPIVDIAAGPDHSLIASLSTGTIAIFDEGRPRKLVDLNTEGQGAFFIGGFRLGVPQGRGLLYAVQGATLCKRVRITEQGLEWLSDVHQRACPGPFFQPIGDRVYSWRGTELDYERARVTGKYQLRQATHAFVADLEANRIYFVEGQELKMFNLSSYALLGQMTLPIPYGEWALEMVRVGTNELAIRYKSGFLDFVAISEIPLLPSPVPTPQPAMPKTDGVQVLAIAASHLVCSASEHQLYASVPNWEGSDGDQVVVVDPEQGAVLSRLRTGTTPWGLALSLDDEHLFVHRMPVGSFAFSGVTTHPVSVDKVRLRDGTTHRTTPDFPLLESGRYQVGEFLVAKDHPNRIIALVYKSEAVWTSQSFAMVNTYVGIRAYEDGRELPSQVPASEYKCSSIVQDTLTGRMYCSDGLTVTKLDVIDSGIAPAGSYSLPQQLHWMKSMTFSDGKLFFPEGYVLEAESGNVVAKLDVRGFVTAEGSRVIWLHEGPPGESSLTLRAFDVNSLQQTGQKTILTHRPGAFDISSCGPGRLAFTTEDYVYLVNY